MSWTDERVSLLKQLWGEGKTAAEIAKILGGVTRNAVIGKAHRLKLSGRVSPIEQNTREETVKAREANTNRPVRAPANRNAPPPPMPEYVPGKGVKLVELRERHCRWPLGDPQDENFMFCGCDALAGLPYCDYHAKVAFQVTSRGKLRVDELAAIDNDVIRKTVNG